MKTTSRIFGRLVQQTRAFARSTRGLTLEHALSGNRPEWTAILSQVAGEDNRDGLVERLEIVYSDTRGSADGGERYHNYL